jgi:hypothetical protein
LKYLNSLAITFLLIASSAFFVSCSEDDGDTSTEKNLEITEANIMGCWKVDEMSFSGTFQSDLYTDTLDYLKFSEKGSSAIFLSQSGFQNITGWNVDKNTEAFYLSLSLFEVERLTSNKFVFLTTDFIDSTQVIRKYSLSKSNECPEEPDEQNFLSADLSGEVAKNLYPDQVMYRNYNDDGSLSWWSIETWYKFNLFEYSLDFSFNEENGEINYEIGFDRTDYSDYNDISSKRFEVISSDALYTEENGIITGTFSFTAQEEETGNVVTCTNGQFTIYKSTAEDDEIARGERKSRYSAKKKSIINIFK